MDFNVLPWLLRSRGSQMFQCYKMIASDINAISDSANHVMHQLIHKPGDRTGKLSSDDHL